MKKVLVWLRADPIRVVLTVFCTICIISIGSIFVWAAVTSAAYDAQQKKEAAAQEKYDREHPVKYTEPREIKALADFYSKNRQSKASRMLNEQLYALTDTLVAPNKAVTIKGVKAVAWGSFGDYCEVLVSHDKDDSAQTFNIEIYQNTGAQSESSKNALDIVPAYSRYVEDTPSNVNESRDHASLKGVNYLLTQTLKKCSA